MSLVHRVRNPYKEPAILYLSESQHYLQHIPTDFSLRFEMTVMMGQLGL